MKYLFLIMCAGVFLTSCSVKFEHSHILTHDKKPLKSWEKSITKRNQISIELLHQSP